MSALLGTFEQSSNPSLRHNPPPPVPPAVSADPNVVRLSTRQEFDLVTSPSALKTLLDNSAPAWDRHWELPVTVRLVPGVQKGTHRK